jgi:hypothetical protein
VLNRATGNPSLLAIDLVDQFSEFAFANGLWVLSVRPRAAGFQCGGQPLQMFTAELELFDEGFELIGLGPDALRNFFPVHNGDADKLTIPKPWQGGEIYLGILNESSVVLA